MSRVIREGTRAAHPSTVVGRFSLQVRQSVSVAAAARPAPALLSGTASAHEKDEMPYSNAPAKAGGAPASDLTSCELDLTDCRSLWEARLDVHIPSKHFAQASRRKLYQGHGVSVHTCSPMSTVRD